MAVRRGGLGKGLDSLIANKVIAANPTAPEVKKDEKFEYGSLLGIL